MSGKILIVDELATNRIALKARLTEAFYDVIQAASGSEALKVSMGARPDLILSGARLSDMDGAEMTQALRAHADLADIPVVLIFDDASDPEKLTALMAGANDVLTKPINEPLLLARLRSLLRQRHSNQDLQLHVGSANALGFSEASKGFQSAGSVALVAPTMADALQLRTTLSSCATHTFIAQSADQAVGHSNAAATPDIFVLKFAQDGVKDGLRLMAELRAAPQTRHCPVIVIPIGCSKDLQATILDMGASDVVSSTVDPPVLAQRISAQLTRKQKDDHLRERLHDGLKAAVIDPLTGLFNRRYAMPYLKRLIKSSAHDGRSFAVMVVDIDHFKRVNDRYGHSAGDSVLAQVAQELRDHLREDDMIARIGGEEFLIVTAGYSRAQAAQAAKRLCRIIQRTAISSPRLSQQIHVTISIGVAMGEDKTSGTPLTAEALLDQADKALYKAKNDGRNTATLSAGTSDDDQQLLYSWV